MKTLITLVLCLFISVSNADFLSAQKDYSDGNFEKAYKEYLTLAKYGNNKAQYNLAVMYIKGQGIDIDLIKAYSWAKASESNPEYSALTNNIEKTLSKEQLFKAKEIYEKDFAQYTFENSKVLLGPIFESKIETDIDANSEKIELVIEETSPPNYPKKMAKKRIQGWVNLSLRVYPDGSARDIYILEEVPPDSFGQEAMKSVEKYRFSFKQYGKKATIDEPQLAVQRIEFLLNGSGVSVSSTEINRQQQDYLDDMIEKANEGDINSQYSYVVLYNTLLNRKGKIGGEKVNQWLFNAAIDGIADAQYRLGLNIYHGNDCKIEKQKGLDWIMQAAQTSDANAQYMAYTMLKNKKLINQSDSSPFYWLQQSAKNGKVIAQLNYAKEVALLNLPTMDQISTAKKYLADYSEKHYESAQWYQINAMLLHKTNKRSKALKSVKKALKSATKLGWDLTELQDLKSKISEKKS